MFALGPRHLVDGGAAGRGDQGPAAGIGDRPGDLDGAAFDAAPGSRAGKTCNTVARSRTGASDWDAGSPRALPVLCCASSLIQITESPDGYAMNDAASAPQPPQILTRPDGSTIAYHKTDGMSPGVVFLSGFMSDMTGGKALFVEEFCRKRGQAFLRFDYFGHGQSSGAFIDGTIGRWADDTAFALDHLTEGPQVLVGSSMGGWLMLLAALARPERVAGLVGIAPAPDFTEDLLIHQFSAEQLQAIERDGVVYVHSLYGPEPTPFTKKLIEDGKAQLVLRRKMPLTCPLRILQGMRDPDVPWQTALRISEMWAGDDVEIHFIKDGDHRLSRPQDLARLARTLDALLEGLAAPAAGQTDTQA